MEESLYETRLLEKHVLAGGIMRANRPETTRLEEKIMI
jgi:hypothetical protein